MSELTEERDDFVGEGIPDWEMRCRYFYYKRITDSVFKYIDRMGDPIETKEYCLDLLENFHKDVGPVLSHYLEWMREHDMWEGEE